MKYYQNSVVAHFSTTSPFYFVALDQSHIIIVGNHNIVI
ncbi:hypothetical protein THOG11_10339 [Vibrio harveyi]|nr:hypothetical protein TH15OA1_200148 [Vibrio harveyi]CAH1547769.1 hypothetical protein THOD03_10341 [Vibrio harveyi]CAH1549660.1 hypothetical protein THOG11_10339 [Vibrio harveyi]